MLLLRTTIRCKLSVSKYLGCTCKSRNLAHLESNATSIPAKIMNRNISSTRFRTQPTLSNLYFMQKKTLASSSENELHVNGLKRVYYGSLTPRMKAVKVFSLTTSLAGLAAQPILLEQGLKIGGTGMAILLCSFGIFFTFITPVLLHFITKKYVTEIHYNPSTEEYVATTINIILQKIQTKFRPDNVKVPEVPGMFTSFTVGNKSLFVDPALFEDPEHYVRIMGYDKPIDFKLGINNETNATTDDIKNTKKPI